MTPQESPRAQSAEERAERLYRDPKLAIPEPQVRAALVARAAAEIKAAERAASDAALERAATAKVQPRTYQTTSHGIAWKDGVVDMVEAIRALKSSAPPATERDSAPPAISEERVRRIAEDEAEHRVKIALAMVPQRLRALESRLAAVEKPADPLVKCARCGLHGPASDAARHARDCIWDTHLAPPAPSALSEVDYEGALRDVRRALGLDEHDDHEHVIEAIRGFRSMADTFAASTPSALSEKELEVVEAAKSWRRIFSRAVCPTRSEADLIRAVDALARERGDGGGGNG